MIGVLSISIRKIPGIACLLGEELVWFTRFWPGDPSRFSKLVGWGNRRLGRVTRAFAEKHQLPFYRLEDGFLRSVGFGRGEPPLSVVVDDRGIYYDATRPSALEAWIARELSPVEQARARGLRKLWMENRVSKYNHSRDFSGPLPENFALVVDQTRHDAAIRYGLADESCFKKMLDCALVENPDCQILLKIHPEVMAGRKKGHFDLRELRNNPRIELLGEDVHPVSLIERAKAVYTVTSQMGFEALLWGKRVRVFGMPFYAGWGLTMDEIPGPRRRKPVMLEQLIHGALVDYPRYLNPETGECCDAEFLIRWMGLQRRMMSRFPEEILAVNFSPWKKPFIKGFFQGSRIRFVDDTGPFPEGATIARWGRKPIQSEIPAKTRQICVEDGFLRSVGLGAALVQPLSWVMDSRGIYYDASTASDLENLLEHADFSEAILGRALKLKDLILQKGITKYNLQGRAWEGKRSADRIILVPGQVESDASIEYGAPGLKTNLDLLRAVRRANPGAQVIYKPHPDVVSGLRKCGSSMEAISELCDEMVHDVPMQNLLEQVDEVHVLTSLAGFEALLRGKKVVCHGAPFYSGWGLTQDCCAPTGRRTRKLTVEALVAATLILYPAYRSRSSGRFTTPERAIEELVEWKNRVPKELTLREKVLQWALTWVAR